MHESLREQPRRIQEIVHTLGDTTVADDPAVKAALAQLEKANAAKDAHSAATKHARDKISKAESEIHALEERLGEIDRQRKASAVEVDDDDLDKLLAAEGGDLARRLQRLQWRLTGLKDALKQEDTSSGEWLGRAVTDAHLNLETVRIEAKIEIAKRTII